MTSGRTRDEVVMTAIKVIVKDPSEGKQVEKLVGMLQSCDSKVGCVFLSPACQCVSYICWKSEV